MDKIIRILYKNCIKAYKSGNIPVACVITKNNKIIAQAYNKKNKNNCCFYHAEILAIEKASKKNKDWRLDDCKLYVTLEPCNMCKEVIRQCRIKKIYYFVNSNFHNEISINSEYTKLEIKNDISDNFLSLLKNFFANKRNKR